MPASPSGRRRSPRCAPGWAGRPLPGPGRRRPTPRLPAPPPRHRGRPSTRRRTRRRGDRSAPMPELTETVDIDAPPERVWAALTDWSRQGEWILATDVRPVVGPARGVGGRLIAVTGLALPGGRRLGVVDTMEITRWEPPTRVDVLHTGRIVRGSGTFEVRPRGDASTFVWSEQVELPLGDLGRLSWPVVGRVVRAAYRRSLQRFARVVVSRG